MTPGFRTQQMPDTTLAQPIFQLRLFFAKDFMAAYNALPAIPVLPNESVEENPRSS
jgi:hypothetical protein